MNQADWQNLHIEWLRSQGLSDQQIYAELQKSYNKTRGVPARNQRSFNPENCNCGASGRGVSEMEHVSHTDACKGWNLRG